MIERDDDSKKSHPAAARRAVHLAYRFMAIKWQEGRVSSVESIHE
jgi:hypothetical protein